MFETKSRKRGIVVRWAIALGLLVTMSSFADTGPVGWWKFDEGSGTTAADSSGYANTGTLVSSPVWTTGIIGSGALTFDGSTNYVNVPNTSGSLDNLHSTGMTVAAWIKATASGGGGGGAGRILNKAGWFFALNAANVRFTDGDTSAYMTSSSAIPINTWVHVAATWNGLGPGSGGEVIHIFVNGVQADSTTAFYAGDAGSTPGPDVGAASIGNRASDHARGFPGTIDNPKVYNRILSAAEIQALADSTAPSTPTGLTATAISSSQVNLSWTASTDNVAVTGYLLERCQGSGCSSFTQIATPTSPSYSDTGRTASTSYTYRVRATDANSNLSGYSSTATATTPAGSGDTTPPTAPTNPAVLASSSSEVDVTWGAATDNVGVTLYLVERCSGTGCSTFSQVGTVAAPPYNDTTVSAGTAYSYRVRAQDGATNTGPYSTVLSTTTPVSSPDCN